jgi:hypothetical protein
MATYTPVPKSVPSPQRSAEITAVAAGDQIDLTEILGRPARRLQFIMTDATDTIDYKLNNLIRIHKKRRRDEAFSKTDQRAGIYDNDIVEVWSQASGISQYQSTGSTTLETAEGLSISSVQIDALSLSSGTTITIICW